MTHAITAVTGRSFEAVAAEACRIAAACGASTLMVFGDVAVQVDPTDDAATAMANHDAAVAAVATRLIHRPLLSERAPALGDVVETLEDDHGTRIAAGSFGIVTNLRDGANGLTTIRFARRTVDYEEADHGSLRHIR